MTSEQKEQLAEHLTSASRELREALAQIEVALCGLVFGQSAMGVRHSADQAAGHVDHARRYLGRLLAQ